MARVPRQISPADAAARGRSDGDDQSLRKKKKKRLLRMENAPGGAGAVVEATPFKKRRAVDSSPSAVHGGPSPIALGALKDRDSAAAAVAAGSLPLEQYIEAMDQATADISVKRLRPAMPPYVPTSRRFEVSNAVLVSHVTMLCR